MMVKPGLYRHYKGGLYRVINVATHSETEEAMVVYQAMYGAKGQWVRPLSMFDEWLDVKGQRVRRFQRCDQQTLSTEVVRLDIKAGQHAEFEKVFVEAQSLIVRAEGYLGHELRRCDGRAGRYLFTVVWESRRHHEEGFRGSPDYRQWCALLHHFYEPMPKVEHYSMPLAL
jgi:heme-degrading monooxygenase HmoA